MRQNSEPTQITSGTLGDLPALLVADGQGSQPALLSSDGGMAATFAELAAAADVAAAEWCEAGLRSGDRVAVWLPRGPEKIVALLAAFRLGAVVVGVPPDHPAALAAHCIGDAESALLVTDAARVQALLETGLALPWRPAPALRPASRALEPARPADLEALAALIYTSGSTGRPKGVMVSHGNFLGAARRVDAYLCHRADDRLMAVMPLSSPLGLLQFDLAWRAGAAVVLPPVATLPSVLAASIRETGVTGLAVLPPTLTHLADWLTERGETLPKPRYVNVLGGRLPDRIAARLPQLFPQAEILLSYGLTEAFRTSVVPAEWFARKSGALGRPCPGVGAAVVHADGREAGPGERGELVHHGSCVTLGYWRRPQETTAAYRPRAGHQVLFPPGARIHYSGDIVERDADGFLWFVGRNDALIKTGGHRVSPEEVERALLATGVVRHAVVGSVPDNTLGAVIVAGVELIVSGAPAGAGLTTVREAMRRHLPAAWQPRHYFVWPGTMPLNASGKLDRLAVLARVRDAVQNGS